MVAINWDTFMEINADAAMRRMEAEGRANEPSPRTPDGELADHKGVG